MAASLRLWKYNRTTGFWDYARNVTLETADQWLRKWRSDEPGESFVVSNNKPSKPPRQETRERSMARYNQRTYKYYVFLNGKIASGWDFREDAKDDLENAPGGRVLSKVYLKGQGVDPDSDANWMGGPNTVRAKRRGSQRQGNIDPKDLVDRNELVSVSMYSPAETYINGKYQVTGTITPSRGIEGEVRQVLGITRHGDLIEIRQDGNSWKFWRDGRHPEGFSRNRVGRVTKQTVRHRESRRLHTSGPLRVRATGRMQMSANRSGDGKDPADAREVLKALGPYLEHEGHDAAKESSRIARMIYGANSSKKREAVLEHVNKLIGGHGTEVIRDENAWDGYYGDAVAEYVNMGDTYDVTLLYDTRDYEFHLTSWGDWYEAYEQERESEREESDGEEVEERRGVRAGRHTVRSAGRRVSAKIEFEEVGSIGDRDWATHGGGPVYRRPDGDAFMVYVEPPPDDVEFNDPSARWTVYSVELDSGLPGWGDAESVAASAGDSVAKLEKAFNSKDPMQRAYAYETWAGHYGWHELDNYPRQLTAAQMNNQFDAGIDLEPDEE